MNNHKLISCRVERKMILTNVGILIHYLSKKENEFVSLGICLVFNILVRNAPINADRELLDLNKIILKKMIHKARNLKSI